MMPRQTRCYSIFSLCFGLLCLILGIFWDKLIYKYFVEKSLVLGTKSPIYEIWHTPPMEMTLNIYLFNWTNPEDFRNESIKPKFEEVGPYRFSETQKKVDIQWHAANASVSYRRKSTYHFISNGSRSLNDVITTINSVAVSTATVSQYMSTTERAMAEIGMMVYPRDLTVRETADALLFTGYKDTLLTILNALPVRSFDTPFDRYGYCYGRNNSPSFFGTFNVHTGEDNIKDLGQLHAWNFKNNSDAYTSKCSKIRGSTGEFFGPHLKTKDTISIFARELCRDMPLEYNDIAYVEGVKGFKYIGGLKAVDNGTLYPENECLCNGECMPSGVMNITSCWFNSPVFISYPHFYKADPYYINQLEGLKPQQDKHEFTYVIEPETSISLEVVARSQMNVLIRPIERSRMFHHVRKIMFPLSWAEVRTRLPSELLAYLRNISDIVFYGQRVAIGLGIISIILAICYPIFYKIRYKLVPPLEAQDLDVKFEQNSTNTRDTNRNLSLDEEAKKEIIIRNSRQPLL